MDSYISSADELMLVAVKRTVAALDLTDKDVAAVKLAEKYATTLDECWGEKDQNWSMRWIGPLLLDVLESLGATPAARGKTKIGTPANAGNNKLHAMRAARRS